MSHDLRKYYGTLDRGHRWMIDNMFQAIDVVFNLLEVVPTRYAHY